MNGRVDLVGSPERDFYNEFGARVRRARQARDLSQDDLARWVGLSRSSIANLESGRQRPPLYVVALLAEVLKTRTSELLPPVTSARASVDLSKLEAELEKLDDDQQTMIRETVQAVGLTLRDSELETTGA